SARRPVSMAMFAAPERPRGSMERWKVGGSGSRSNLPTFRPSVSVSRKRVRLHGRADAHQVPVAERALYATHRWPDLVRPRPDGREGGALARVRAVPRIGDHVPQRVRGVREQVVAARLCPVFDLLDLLPDRDEGIAEAV